MPSFSEQIAAFTQKAHKRIRAASRDAVQETLAEASVPRGKGGRMRIDTGFLRSSLQASLDGMPSGPTQNEDNTDYGDAESTEGLPADQVAGDSVASVLLQWDPVFDEEFYAGWTAAYARHREAHDGFLEGAVENWPDNLERSAKKAKASIR